VARLFSIKPTLTMKGRKFKGIRGLSGKPFHPPLTDIPVACWVLVGVFDLIAYLAGEDSTLANDFYISATHVVIAGLIVAAPTILTGMWDWLKSMTPHTQAWRTANWHMAVMLTTTALVVGNVVLRLGSWDDGSPSLGLTILSVAISGLVSFGALYGGTLVYEHQFNVESLDNRVWEPSERDVYPTDHGPPTG
jgi:uncharacterized membrane protein